MKECKFRFRYEDGREGNYCNLTPRAKGETALHCTSMTGDFEECPHIDNNLMGHYLQQRILFFELEMLMHNTVRKELAKLK